MGGTGHFYGYAPSSYFPALSLTQAHRLVLDRGLSDQKQSGVKGKKMRLTYTFTSNADRSKELPPLIISKAAQP